MDLDKNLMKMAIGLAKRRKGLTHPNPTVGAIIVKDGEIIGKGFHRRAGLPHAEREAIKDAKSKGFNLKDSTMYVTLEPCCHYGKTPPCTEAIIEEGIKRVVVATLDPNPLVAGQGIEILKSKGIEVNVGVLEEEAKKLNEDFFTYITKRRPFIHLKVAQTLDGKIATKDGNSKWITSEKSRKYVHKLRYQSTAIMVAKNTVLKDNPFLTVRGFKVERQPVRVIIDKNLEVPLHYNIFNTDAKTMVICNQDADDKKFRDLKHIKILKLPLGTDKKFNLTGILDSLYKEEIVHLFVEGGKELITQFIKENLWDKLSVFIAPKMIGEDGISVVGPLDIKYISQAVELKIGNIKRIDKDIYISLTNISSI